MPTGLFAGVPAGPGCSPPALPGSLRFFGGASGDNRSVEPSKIVEPLASSMEISGGSKGSKKGWGNWGPALFAFDYRMKSNPAEAGFSDEVRRAAAHRRL